ncbi:MAG: hypothetical protein N4A62_00715 [Marinisporobacter sp.]|nr:hypothetical protein [Marinisporobacter sp.]
MFFDWLSDLGILDKIIVIFSAILFIVFIGYLWICRFKYEWKREQCDEYLKACHDDEKFKNLKDKNN